MVKRTDNLGVVLEQCLEDTARQYGHELDRANEECTPADVLYLRLLDLAFEEAVRFPKTRNQTLLKVTWAFVILAFPYFSEVQRSVMLDMYCEENRNPLFKKAFSLAPYQKKILVNIAKRVEILLNENDIPKTFSFASLAILLPKRIIEIEDSETMRILDKAYLAKDKIGYILEEIIHLPLKQQVHLLVLLSDEEYEEYLRRRKEDYQAVLDKIDRNSDKYDKVSYLKMRSTIQYGKPCYEGMAESRRRYIDRSGSYPAILDNEFKEMPDLIDQS